MDVSAKLAYGFIVPPAEVARVTAAKACVKENKCRLEAHGYPATDQYQTVLVAGPDWDLDLCDYHARAVNLTVALDSQWLLCYSWTTPSRLWGWSANSTTGS